MASAITKNITEPVLRPSLRCACDSCLANHCTTNQHGLCFASVDLNASGAIKVNRNCFNQEFSLIQNLVCNNSTVGNAPKTITICCDSGNFCNNATNFNLSIDEARQQLIESYNASSTQKVTLSGLLPSAIFEKYSSIPLELKMTLVVLAALSVIFALALAHSFYRRRTIIGPPGDGPHYTNAPTNDDHQSESSSDRLMTDAAVCDNNSMASRERLINNSKTNSPVFLTSQVTAMSHPLPKRGPWAAETIHTGKIPSGFQMTVGACPEPKKQGTSSGSGSGQPYLSQRSIADDIQLKDVIGRGYFGVVYHGEYKGEPVAVKIFSAPVEASWSREVEIYQTTLLRHKNILGFIAADKKQEGSMTGFWLVTDYYPMGALYDFLKRESIEMCDAIRMCFSIANGLSHLHGEICGTQGKPAVAHRDLKSKNILVKSDGTCCIADLGMAVRFSSKSGIVDVPTNSRVGTRRYQAPEILNNTLNLMDFESVKATDIYSLGLVFWEILRRTLLGNLQESAGASMEDLQDDFAFLCDPYEAPYQEFVSLDPTSEEMYEVVCAKKIRPPLSPRWSKSAAMREFSNLIIECWYEKPQSRLPALRLRKSLGDIARSYFNINMEYD